jgi:uncharacterized short protein YbdD (DUF466 family)
MKQALLKLPRRLWDLLRSISGDDAYDRYLVHLQQQHPDAVPLSRRRFYAAEQQRRWNGGPNRCC